MSSIGITPVYPQDRRTRVPVSPEVIVLAVRLHLPFVP
jgi:hypothetical protein